MKTDELNRSWETNRISLTSPNPPSTFSIKGLFVLPLWKLIFMSTATLGLYEIYWFYKNWVAIKQSEGSKIRPFWRALFCNFTAYALFRRLRIRYAALLAIPYFIFAAFLWRLPGFWWLISFFGVLFLLPAQARINQLQGEKPTNSLSWREGLVAAAGLILLFAAIVGTFLES